MFCIIARDLMGNPVWWEHCVKQHEEKKIKLVMEHSFKNCFTLFSSEYWKCICLLFSCLYLMNFYSRIIFFSLFRLRDNGELFEKFEHREYDFAHQTEKSCAEEYKTCPYSIYQVNFWFELNKKKFKWKKNICTTLECVFYYCNF